MAATGRKYDLYGEDFRADPYRVFAQMRRDDPVVQQPGLDGETMIWFATPYEDVAAVAAGRRALRARSAASSSLT